MGVLGVHPSGALRLATSTWLTARSFFSQHSLQE